MATVATPRANAPLTTSPTSPKPLQSKPQFTNQSSTNIAKATAYFDLALSLLLYKWAPLTLAVNSLWGGPDSADKRDWLVGVLSDQFTSDPSTDAEDIESIVMQVMQDEFDVRLEDQSEEQLATDILRWRRTCFELGPEGWERVEEMRRKWEEKQSGKTAKVEIVEGNTDDREDEWSDESDAEEGGVGIDADAVMEEAPPMLVEKREPEVDEDGFTKVVGRRKR